MQAYHAIPRILPLRLRDGVRELAYSVFADQLGWRPTIRASMEIVDDDYRRGRWDYLNNLEEMSRYAVIAGYCKHSTNVLSVLDLGCGSAILRRWLRPPESIDYVGVDLSNVAIDRAGREWTDGSTRFIAADAATYVPDRKFDVVIFNEVLYYFEQPSKILEHFAGFLEDNGHFVIPLWMRPSLGGPGGQSRGSVRVVDAVQTRHCSGVSWQICLCRPRL